MWDYFFGIGRKISNQVGHLDRGEWLILLVLCVVVGFVCMRGFAGRGRI